MKECDYCGRENEDDAVYCRECGTEKFKGDPPEVRIRPSAGEVVKNCASSLDELASSREILIAWVMAAWIVAVSFHLIRQDFAQAPLYVGLRTRWWLDVGVPLLIGATFLLAPVIGIYSIVRWLRKGKKRTLSGLMAWMLLAFFVTICCMVWLVLWNANSEGWYNFVRP